jgi:hypothetical protein
MAANVLTLFFVTFSQKQTTLPMDFEQFDVSQASGGNFLKSESFTRVERKAIRLVHNDDSRSGAVATVSIVAETREGNIC